MLETIDDRVSNGQPKSCQVKIPAHLQSRLLPGNDDSEFSDRRRFMRRNCFTQIVVDTWQTLPAIPRETTSRSAYSLNISKIGIGVLLDEQLYPGETLRIQGGPQQGEFIVKRCWKHGPNCYEIGLIQAEEDDELV